MTWELQTNTMAFHPKYSTEKTCHAHRTLCSEKLSVVHLKFKLHQAPIFSLEAFSEHPGDVCC